MSTSSPLVENGDGRFDSVSFASVLWQRRKMIVIMALAGAVCLAALSLVMTPVYRSTAMLVPATLDRSILGGGLSSALGGSVGDLASLAGFNLPNDQEAEEALAVLESEQLTRKFISDNDLMPILFAKIWDPATRTWKVPPKKQPTLAKAFRAFERIRYISKNSKTGLITVQIDWRDRNLAAAWCNGLVNALNAEMRARATQSADASLQFLTKELASTSEVGTRDAVNHLIETQIKQRMLANVTSEYAMRFVDHGLVSDTDDPIRPKKVLMTAAGLLLGMLFGVSLAMLLNFRDMMVRRNG